MAGMVRWGRDVATRWGVELSRETGGSVSCPSIRQWQRQDQPAGLHTPLANLFSVGLAFRRT